MKRYRDYSKEGGEGMRSVIVMLNDLAEKVERLEGREEYSQEIMKESITKN